MKSLLTIIGLSLLIGSVSGQEFKSRQPYPGESQRIAGFSGWSQEELHRRTVPRFAVNTLTYGATNWYDGVLFVRTNATVLVVVELPNPTNHPSRRFEVVTSGASTVRLTNALGAPFHDANMMTNSAVGQFVQSNRTAVAYSTGTNWTVAIRQ